MKSSGFVEITGGAGATARRCSGASAEGRRRASAVLPEVRGPMQEDRAGGAPPKAAASALSRGSPARHVLTKSRQHAALPPSRCSPPPTALTSR